MEGKRAPEEIFRAVMAGESPDAVRQRRLFRRIPSDPRCKQCNTPFGLPGLLYSRAIGRAPWPKNKRFCSQCYSFLRQHGIGGAEVTLTILFADVRGSTGLAEQLGAREFTRRINRFYRDASSALLDADGLVDKFVGDGVIGLFIPGMSGPDYANKAVDAARGILRLSADVARDDDRLPIGVGVHTGVAFVGAMGDGGEVDDFTALGDSVNAAARLGSEAGAGEGLISEATATAAGLDFDGFERRHLVLKGRQEPMDVLVLQAT
jgi:adenylate cyclase